MKLFNKILIFTIIEILIINQIFAIENKTQVDLSQTVTITGVAAKQNIIIKSSQIEKSISNNTMLRLYYVIRTCVFTNQQDGDFNMVITTDNNFLSGEEFALYNNELGKIPIKLLIVSNGSKFKETIAIPNKQILLRDHSDIGASGMNCQNLTRFRIGIEPNSLRRAKAGTYDFAMSISVSNVE